MNREEIITIILEEIRNQEAKWGRNDVRTQSRYEYITILTEELGEVARAVLKEANNTHRNEQHSYYNELIQVAAVAISAMEVDRAQQNKEKNNA